MRFLIFNILLILSIVITVVFGISIYDSLNRKQKAESWVLHTYEVIQKTTEILSLLKDTETGQRGFLLTGKESFLEPYRNSLNQIELDLLELHELTKDNPKQQHNLYLLQKYIRHKIDFATRAIHIYQQNGAESAVDWVNTGKGQTSMDSIRSITKRMLQEEDQLLAIRSRELDSEKRRVNLVVFFGLIFIGAMSLLALVFVNKTQAQNLKLIKDLERYNQNLENEVKRRTEELETANNRLRLLNDEKDHFLGMAAHDLKNPINNAKVLLDLAEATIPSVPPSAKELLDHARSSLIKMAKLISDLLNINKIETSTNELELERFETREVVAQVIAEYRTLAQNKQIDIHFLVSEDEPYFIVSHKGFLKQILDNLISNAIKYTYTGKNVFVELSKNTQYLQIVVKDEGQGIKKEELQYLFERFRRLSSKPTAGESSTGLGLSIVKSLVVKLQGIVTCDSEEGKGTSFIIELPL